MFRKTAVLLAVLFGALWLAFSATTAFATPISPPSTPGDSPGDPTVVDQCAATAPGTAHCLSVRRTDPGSVHPALTPNTAPAGYSPANLHAAYNLPATGGTGTTVAIIDAYDNPNAEADLNTYRAQYGLPACTTANGCFRKLNQNGAPSPLPSASTAWAGEIDLDIQMVSAISPNSHILLVEANSASFGDLGTAVNAAVAAGARFVSNSYGGPEYSGQTGADASSYHHPGVVITASTGDDGYGIAYPASSPYVTAVGGTSLHTANTPRGWSETAWSGAGSGCSAYEPKPAFQTGLTTGCGNRANADVAAVADPNTGVAVYQSYGGTGWTVYGGTSVASPIIASVYALAGTPAATDTPVTYPYTHPTGLHDVTTGSNGTCTTPVQCTAGPGWDGPTGLGTPNGLSAFTPTTSGGSTPPPAPTCPAPGQKLGNPGFETGTAAPWTATPGVISTAGYGRTPHSGSYFAWLDGYGTTHTDTLTQTLTLPAGCHASLAFWLHTDTAETTATATDTLTVQLGTTTLATFSNRDAAAGYQQHTYDVSAFAGQTVTLKFTGTENASRQTSFLVDDTALSAS